MNIYLYMFTYGGPQLFVLLVIFVLTPIGYRKFLKKRPMRVRIISVLGIWVGTVIVAYGDVFVIALEAKRLCGDEAGMKVYRTIQADGILGYVSVRDHQGHGIKYVESATSSGRPLLRESIENGEYTEERIDTFTSQVQLARNETRRTIGIVRVQDLLIERSTGSMLAEIIAFEFYPGWIDSRLLGLLGFSWTPPRCDDDYVPRQGHRRHHISEFIRRTINTN